jgi:hypothetical protein
MPCEKFVVSPAGLQLGNPKKDADERVFELAFILLLCSNSFTSYD